ncbi:MAG TPA: hypothetical protein VGK45_05940 [Thermoanaerobaculia bacterium]
MNVKLKLFVVLAVFLVCLPTVAAARITEDVEILAGNVVISRSGDLDLMVMVDHLPLGGDGAADQAFLYRSKTALPASLQSFSGPARVLVSSDAIIVAFDEGTVVSLMIRNEGNRGFNPDLFSEAAHVTTVDSGFQLTRLYSRPGVDLVNVAFAQLRSTLGENRSLLDAAATGDTGDTGEPGNPGDTGTVGPPPPPPPPPLPCVAGGPGSASCSVTAGAAGVTLSCSVSCGSGYFSCCTINGCHCNKSAAKGMTEDPTEDPTKE